MSICSLKDILIFVTGADVIPGTGFHKRIEINFIHDDYISFSKADTCSLELHLPTCHSSYDKFKENMDFGIGNCNDFGMI